jgi:hypothetical protein
MTLEGFALIWKVTRTVSNTVDPVYKQPGITRAIFVEADSFTCAVCFDSVI